MELYWWIFSDNYMCISPEMDGGTLVNLETEHGNLLRKEIAR